MNSWNNRNKERCDMLTKKPAKKKSIKKPAKELVKKSVKKHVKTKGHVCEYC